MWYNLWSLHFCTFLHKTSINLLRSWITFCLVIHITKGKTLPRSKWSFYSAENTSNDPVLPKLSKLCWPEYYVRYTHKLQVLWMFKIHNVNWCTLCCLFSLSSATEDLNLYFHSPQLLKGKVHKLLRSTTQGKQNASKINIFLKSLFFSLLIPNIYFKVLTVAPTECRFISPTLDVNNMKKLFWLFEKTKTSGKRHLLRCHSHPLTL